jgi:hypothetical protein
MKRKKLFSILSVVIVMILIFCNTTTIYAGVKIRTPSTSGITRSENCIKIKWKKVNGINGYQIQYSTNKEFKKAKKITIKSKTTTSKTIKNIGNSKKYYIRIRSYKKNKGKDIYSNWSKNKVIKPIMKHCTNNNNHSMSCGNMGRWFNNKKEIELYLKEIDNNYSRKYENGEITYKEYVTKVPSGYECWSCSYCGKWTGNLKHY